MGTDDREGPDGPELCLGPQLGALRQARTTRVQAEHLIVTSICAVVEHHLEAPPQTEPRSGGGRWPGTALDAAHEAAAAHVGPELSLVPRTARTLVEDAWYLARRVPVLGRCLAEGSLDLPRARAVAAETSALDDDEAATLVEGLVRGGIDLARPELLRRVRRRVRRAEEARERAEESRSGTVRPPEADPAHLPVRAFLDHHDDGTSTIGAVLPTAVASGLWDLLSRAAALLDTRLDDARVTTFVEALDSLAARRAGAGGAGPQDDGSEAGRTGAGARSRGRHRRHRSSVVQLNVALRTVTDADALEPGELHGPGGVSLVPADHVRAAVAELIGEGARWQVVGTDATGRVLAVTSPSYRIPAPLRNLVKLRDRRCCFPGCTRPAWTTDLDHVRAWPEGPTASDNLACLCRRHHRLKTHHGWSYRLLDDQGTVEWTSPAGRTHLVTARTYESDEVPAEVPRPRPGEGTIVRDAADR